MSTLNEMMNYKHLITNNHPFGIAVKNTIFSSMEYCRGTYEKVRQIKVMYLMSRVFTVNTRISLSIVNLSSNLNGNYSLFILFPFFAKAFMSFSVTHKS